MCWLAGLASMIGQAVSASKLPDTPIEQGDQLSLFVSPSCGYCRRVMKTLVDRNIECELLDISVGPGLRLELRELRGRMTVPVLRVLRADGTERIVAESAVIVSMLTRYDEQRGRPRVLVPESPSHAAFIRASGR